MSWSKPPPSREAGTLGSPCSAATWRPCATCARSLRHDQRNRGPTGVGSLPGLEYVKEKVWPRSVVGAINELGGRETSSSWSTHVGAVVGSCRSDCRVRFAARLLCKRDGRGRDHSRFWPRSWLCRRRGHRKTCFALLRRGLVSLPHVKAGLVPLCSMVPPKVRSLLEDVATSPLMHDLKAGWLLMHAFVTTIDCTGSFLETCSRRV